MSMPMLRKRSGQRGLQVADWMYLEMTGLLLLPEEQCGADSDPDDSEVTQKEGASQGRTLSVQDLEMRHGHKSRCHRFDGHKAAAVVDFDSPLITVVDVLPGKAWDSRGPATGRTDRGRRRRLQPWAMPTTAPVAPTKTSPT